jgi:hypothetical protein
MRYPYFGCVLNRVALVPHAPAQIHLFAVVEELRVKATDFPQQLATHQDTTARLPVDGFLGVSIPSDIGSGTKLIREKPQPA